MTRSTVFRRLMLCLAVFFSPGLLAQANDVADVIDDNKPITVATKVAPPFAMKADDGSWTGISINLWQALAADLGLETRFVEATLVDMINGVADGRFAASIAATTITPDREQLVDFSHPFFTTGFAIAVKRGDDGWLQMVKSLISFDFFKAICLLAMLLGFVGLFFWLAEHRRNQAEFRPAFWPGLGDGFWLAAVTMTTVGYGDVAPRTFGGRIIALVWMFTAILIISTFTGMIASSLTADRLSLSIEKPSDLAKVLTATVNNTASAEWLTERGVGFQSVDSVAAGLAALASGEIEALVYDRPLLQYLVNQQQGRVELVPGSFGRQDYGIALPSSSELREPLNQALLHYLDSDAWEGTLTRYLGRQ
ncbi:MAG: transporter substrate-binding domain-containing protein [Granulosicoccus sp.]